MKIPAEWLQFKGLKPRSFTMFIPLLFCTAALFPLTRGNNYNYLVLLVAAMICAVFYIGDILLNIYNHWRFFYAEKED